MGENERNRLALLSYGVEEYVLRKRFAADRGAIYGRGSDDLLRCGRGCGGVFFPWSATARNPRPLSPRSALLPWIADRFCCFRNLEPKQGAQPSLVPFALGLLAEECSVGCFLTRRIPTVCEDGVFLFFFFLFLRVVLLPSPLLGDKTIRLEGVVGLGFVCASPTSRGAQPQT